ncbi:MAG: adenylate/guanylate cyclase domain-containing protein [Hyphomicrobium sp.]
MAEERVQRRLAAILAADVVGYSRLMEQDETGTLARLKSLRSEVFDPRTKQFDGRIFKNTGDGALAEFGSAVDAVQCAVEIQRALAQRNADLPEDLRIILRIGISLGDVIVEGDDLYGNGVNVAARMEGLAEPGAICVSGNVHEHIGNALDVTFEDLGEQSVKNIDRPVRSYRVHLEPAAESHVVQQQDTPPALPDKPSIAVLPFDNLSGDPEQDYFADGMAEDIITALSRFRWFFVIARNSSFTYKGKAVDVRSVGRELGVRYVLEGSVRKGGSRLRITAQLVEAATGNHIWAENYDGELADVFDLQDRITEGVVGAVEPSVRQAEINRAQRKRPESLDAYDNYLRALPHVWANTVPEHTKAIAHLDQALTIDPTYAAAHGLAALCHYMQFTQGGLDQIERTAAVHHARTVLAHVGDDSNALAFAGLVLAALERDFTAALGAVDKAVALNPNSSRAHTNRSAVLIMSGRDEEAFEAATTANRLSPLDPMRYGPEVVISVVHFVNGRYLEAIEAAKRSIQSSPSLGAGHAMLTASYVRAGKQAEAQDALRRLREVQPQYRLGSMTVASDDYVEVIDAALREAGLPE